MKKTNSITLRITDKLKTELQAKAIENKISIAKYIRSKITDKS